MTMKESKGIILVADDSADALGMLNEALINEGYTIFVALDGVQALAIAGRMAPDIILMDAIMPNMDGFEACLALKENTELSDVPVIFMTGLSDPEHVVKGLEAGGVDYITKPVNLDELLARIRIHLKNSRLTRSARNALDGLGQPAFACDPNGELLWATSKTQTLLTANPALNEQLPPLMRQWFARHPQKHDTLTLTGSDIRLQVRFLGRCSPGEYLLRLLDDDELTIRNALRQQFSLTDREAEVLFWISRGKTNREIGQILSMSPRTVNKHLESIYRKLNVENRTSAAAACLHFLNNE